jgi:Flp pilus assembly protein TadD
MDGQVQGPLGVVEQRTSVNSHFMEPRADITYGFKGHFPCILILVVLGIISYSNTLDVPFYLDDIPNIVDNSMIRDVSSIPSMFLHIKGHLASRPATLASFALNYALCGLDTTLYHVVNISLHVLNGILLYILVTMTARMIADEGSDIRLSALFSAAIFVVHPIQTETVTYIVSRSMLLVTTFYLTGIILFAKAASRTRGEGGRGVYVLALFLAAFMGVSSREDFATFPVMLILYDYFFISGRKWRGVLHNRWLHLPGVISLGYLAFLVASYEYIGAGRAVESITPLNYLVTQSRVLWTYIRLLALPVNQNLDYNYPIAKTLFEPSTLLSFIGYIMLWCTALYFIRRKPVPSFLVFWFLICLIPSSSVVPLVDMIFEHRLYLSSVGAFTALSLAVVSCKEGRLKSVLIPAAALSVITLTLFTLTRNTLWRDEVGFWEDVSKKSPEKARPHNSLGVLYEEGGRYDDAIVEYRNALGIDPFYSNSRVNLGILFMNRGHYEEAVKEFEAAVRTSEHLNKDDTVISPKAHYNIGVVHFRLGRYDEAEEEFLEVLRRIPAHAEARNNLGVLYERMGSHEDALREYLEALKLRPGFSNAHFNLGVLYEKLGRYDMAENAYLSALRLDPGYAEAHNNLGALYVKTRRYKEATKEFQAAVDIRPKNETFRQNLMRAYEMMEATGR